MKPAFSGMHHDPIGTPLDELSEGAYLVVSARIPEDLPAGRCGLVLKRLEDDNTVWGVVAWEPSIANAQHYVRDLARQQREWEAIRDEDEHRP